MRDAKTRGRGRVRVGALVVLSTCFIASALIRVGDVVAALPEAKASPDLVNEPQKGDAKRAEPDGDGGVRGPTEVLAELKRQRELLNVRETRLAEREQQLRALELRLANRLEELKSERKRLEETAALVNDAAGKDVRRLAEMYGQMKPKQAAQIFDRMPPSFAAGFLSEMRAEAAAAVLQYMQADRAYAVSLMLAGRNVERDATTPAPAAE